MESKAMYERWLIERVLIHCWTTARCAAEINAEPAEVEADFNEVIERVPWLRR